MVAHEIQQGGEAGGITILIPSLARRDHGVVQLVQRRRLVVGEAVLVLAGDAHDHAWPLPLGGVAAESPPPEAICGASPPSPEPSSLFIFASSSSTAGWLESCLS